jgi:hypothetical protein
VVFGTTMWPQVVGVLLLLAALVGGFTAVGPGELADEDTLDGALTADIGAGRKLRMS